MAKPIWSYLQNRFDNVTKHNFRRMYLMSTDHFDKLAGNISDPYIADLYNFGKPAFDEFVTQFRKNGTVASDYRMHTLRFKNEITALSSTLARRWDVAIQAQFDINTPEYVSLMPQSRTPFQTGAYDIRLSAVLALANQLAQYPDLATLRTEVIDFHTQAIALRSVQQGVEGFDQNNSKTLEDSRFALAEVMLAILGGLMRQYYNKLSKIESFYELKYLRRSPNNSYDDEAELSEEITIPMNGSATALTGQLTLGRTVRVTNTGAAVLTAFGAPDGNASARPNQSYLISAGQNITFQTVASDTLVRMLNDSDPFDGKALVELL